MRLKRAAMPLASYLFDRMPTPELNKWLQARARQQGGALLATEYPFVSKPRWTVESPHAGICQALDKRRDVYARHMLAFNEYAEMLRRIPSGTATNESGPSWNNGWIPALDSIAIYGFLASRRPGLYLEVGSGNSTKFAHRAIEDHHLNTRIVSIDPEPRADVADIARVLRQGLETVDLSVFDEAGPGDIVFIDNSHRTLMNSDVTTFFLDVLPRLKPGVLVGIHDVFWPLDYPEDWSDRFYSEQYLLAPLILWKPDFDVVLPAFFVSVYPREEMLSLMDPLWQVLPPDIERFGGAFWFEWR